MNKWRALLINPVLNKETKLRFRSMKSIWGIFFYLFVMGLVSLGMLYAMTSGGSRPIRSEDSRNLFMVITIAQMALIMFMAPGLTSGVISSEREKQTLNIMLTTRQSSSSIILGKLVSSLAFLALMVVSSLPLYSIVFLYGGVSPRELLLTFTLFFVTMLATGSLGVLFSTLIRKTIVSMITTYGVGAFIVVFFFLFIAVFQEALFTPSVGTIQSGAVNPIAYFLAATNPVMALYSVFDPTVVGGMLNQYGKTYSSVIPIFIISYLVLSVIVLYIAIIRLRPRTKSGKGSEPRTKEPLSEG